MKIRVYSKKDFINLIVTNRINLREIIKNFDCEIIENCTQISASNLNHQQIKEFYIFTSDKIPDLKSAYQSGNSFKFVVKEKINVKMIEELHKLLFTHVIQ